jgi:3-oxoadipate enol-lactonase
VAGVFPAEVDAWWREMTARLAATGWAGHSELARSPSLADAYCDTSPAGAYLYQLIAGLNPPPSMTGPAMRVRDVDLTADEIASVATPVHFVVGARDIAIPPAACRAAAREVPGASFTELAGLGHVCFFEAPEVFNPWLVDVLRSPAP